MNRERLAELADALIPAEDGMPSASETARTPLACLRLSRTLRISNPASRSRKAKPLAMRRSSRLTAALCMR